MAKLYWRVKRDGKWTWKSAEEVQRFLDAEGTLWVYTDEGIESLEEEE